MNTSMRKIKRRLMTLKSMSIPYNKKVGNVSKVKQYEEAIEKGELLVMVDIPKNSRTRL